MASLEKIMLPGRYKESKKILYNTYYISLFNVWQALTLFCILMNIPTGYCKHTRFRRDLVSLTQMLSYKVRIHFLEFNNYGNYCGFLGNGNPIDEVDMCCKIHDQCYEHSVESPGACYGIGYAPYYWVPYKWISYNGIIECDFQALPLEHQKCATYLCDCDREFVTCVSQNEVHFKQQTNKTNFLWRFIQYVLNSH